MKVHFERGKGDQRGKRRPQEEKGGQGVDEGGNGGGGLGGNVVDLLLEQLEYSQTIIPGGVSAPPTAYRSGGKWKVWKLGQATYCLRSGLDSAGAEWRSQGKGAVAALIPEEFALHSGRIGGAMKLAEMGAPSWMSRRERRWAS